MTQTHYTIDSDGEMKKLKDCLQCDAVFMTIEQFPQNYHEKN